MNRSRHGLIGGLAGIFLALSVAGSAAAYWKQTPHTVTINGPRGPIECGEWVTFRATIRDANGDPIANGGPVTWSFKESPSEKDRIKDTQSTTNSNGVATTRIRFACVPGERVIQATAENVRGTITVRVATKHDDDDGDDDKDDRDLRAAVQGAIARPGDPSLQGASDVTAVRATVELPRTSTAPGLSSPGTLLSAIIALIALLAGSGLVIRRLALPRH